MKVKFILLSLCIITCLSTNAQVRLLPYYPYSLWTLGAGVGFSEIYGNLSHSNSEPIVRVNLERNSNMWVTFGAEYQRGALSDYEVKTKWTSGLSVYNQMSAIDVNAKISVGEFFKYPKSFLMKTLFGIYVGGGVGYMYNNVSNISLKFNYSDKFKISEYDNNNIRTSSSNAFIPLDLGINIHMTRRCMLNVNYQFSYAFSDYLDGYDFQAPTATNKYNDMFSVLSFGLNFYIGKISYHYKKHGSKR